MTNRSRQGLEGCAKRGISHKRERRHRVAVIRAVERNHTGAPEMLLRELERGLDRLGAAVGEIDA